MVAAIRGMNGKPMRPRTVRLLALVEVTVDEAGDVEVAQAWTYSKGLGPGLASPEGTIAFARKVSAFWRRVSEAVDGSFGLAKKDGGERVVAKSEEVN